MHESASGPSQSLERLESHSTVWVASARFAGAVVVIFLTAILKLPETDDVQPGGGGAEGEMAAVTACGMATGLARAAEHSTEAVNIQRILATRARRSYRMDVCDLIFGKSK